MLKKNGDDDEENISSSQKKTSTISSSSCSSLFPRLPPPEQSNIITYQPTNQTTNQPTNQPTKQPTNQPPNQTHPQQKRKKKEKKKHSIPHGRKANQTKPLFPRLFFFQCTCALTNTCTLAKALPYVTLPKHLAEVNKVNEAIRSTRYLIKLLGLSEEEWMEWMCKIDQSVLGADEHVKTYFQGRLHRSGNG